MENVVGSLRKGVSTRRQLANYCEHYAFVSCVEPQKVYEVLEDSDWLNAMHEELNNFEYNKLWRLVPRPSGNHNVIGTKGFSRTSKMLMGTSFATRQDW